MKKKNVIVKGCTSCPYRGSFELRDCPDAYTPVSQFCNLYSKEVVYNGKEN